MNFKSRNTSPTKSSKWYGDKNPFIGTKYDMFKNHPKKLGNCTHYAYSRASEILGKESKLPSNNASSWYDKTSYPKGKTPELGSVIVYKHKNKSGGHVAIVEEIKSNGNLILSMSGWNSGLWWTREVKKSNNYCYSDYDLIGFIYILDKKETKFYSGKYPNLPKRGYFQFKDKGKNVELLQQLLNWLNDDNLKIDGIIGDKTISSIEKFQKNNKLIVDGLFGKKSLEISKGIKK